VATGGNKRAFLRLALLLLGTVAGLLLAELGLRLRTPAGNKPAIAWQTDNPPPPYGDREAGFGEMARYSEYPDLIYELKPNIDTGYSGARVRTNSEGLRAEREYARPKPPGVYRVLLLGDSQTFGNGVELEDTFGYLLEQELHRRSQGRRVEVINSGVDGYCTGQQAAFLESRGIGYDPDCVIILFIGNDLELADWLLEPFHPLSDDRSYLLEEMKVLMGHSRAERQELRVPKAYRHMVGREGYKTALRRIARVAAPRSVPVINFLGGQARLAAINDAQYWKEVELLQRELGIVCPDFEYPWGPQWWISEQNKHLSPFGHRVLLERMLKGMEQAQVCLPDLMAGRP
jgi:hypothetical protein